MTRTVSTTNLATASIETLDAKAWRDDLLAHARAGMRVVTMYGRRSTDVVAVTAVLQDADRNLRVTRTRVTEQFGYHELTSDVPALHCFERELHEQTGVRIAGHPWLKPIRFEGADQAAMAAYPYYKIEGKEVHEVAVGPIHAGVIEPGSFRFMCLGERVYHLEIQLGYQHRGVERRLLDRDPRVLTPLVETIAGDSSVGHAWAYCAALESLAGVRPSDEAEVSRAVVLELERIAMHLATLSGLAGDIGLLQGASTYGRLRTTAINATMQLCGSRFGRGALRPGANRFAIDVESRARLRASVTLLQTDLASINELVLEARTVQHRLRGVGTLALAQAEALGVVGVVARASGVALDARRFAESGVYHRVPIAIAAASDGDCWARMQIRLAEIDASLAWLGAILDADPEWSPSAQPIGALASDRLAIAIVEGVRGEIVHCIETGDQGEVIHYKAQDPSLRNWMGLAIAVRNNEISDFPICNKSFDLSYCGNDL